MEQKTKNKMAMRFADIKYYLIGTLPWDWTSCNLFLMKIIDAISNIHDTSNDF